MNVARSIDNGRLQFTNMLKSHPLTPTASPPEWKSANLINWTLTCVSPPPKGEDAVWSEALECGTTRVTQ